MRQQGQSGRAAQLCTELNFNGFSDWFLPSRDELNLIYENLFKVGLGDFNKEELNSEYGSVYWSSSQAPLVTTERAPYRVGGTPTFVPSIGALTAWGQSFFNGRQGMHHKEGGWRVRSVRAF